MTIQELHQKNIQDAERALDALGDIQDYGLVAIVGHTVIQHALESIIKRSQFALEGAYDDQQT